MRRIHTAWGTPLVALAIAGMTLTGCSQAAEQVAESATGVEVDVSDGGISITDGAGNTVGGGGTELPDSFPTDLPLPDGASIQQFQEQNGAVAVSFAVPSLTEAEFEAYLATLAGAGYTETDRRRMDLGGGYSIDAFLTGPTRDAEVSGAALTDGSQSRVTIVVSPEK